MCPATEPSAQLAGLPGTARLALEQVLSAVHTQLGSALQSAVLFGSAAEDRLRPNSDINLLLILSTFSLSQIDPLRETLRAAHTAARLEVMFVLASELADAADAFAVKFGDIRRRHILLAGADLLSGLQISPEAQLRRVSQVLLNLTIRLRARYAFASLREEQLARLIAEFAAPLRTSAATLLELQGQAPPSPRAALEQLAQQLAPGQFLELLAGITQARTQGTLPAGVGATALAALLDLAMRLRALANQLASQVPGQAGAQ